MNPRASQRHCGYYRFDLSLRALKSWSSLQGERIIEFLLPVLENKELDEVQAVVCVGILKLMLSGKVSNEWVRSLTGMSN